MKKILSKRIAIILPTIFAIGVHLYILSTKLGLSYLGAPVKIILNELIILLPYVFIFCFYFFRIKRYSILRKFIYTYSGFFFITFLSAIILYQNNLSFKDAAVELVVQSPYVLFIMFALVNLTNTKALKYSTYSFVIIMSLVVPLVLWFNYDPRFQDDASGAYFILLTLIFQFVLTVFLFTLGLTTSLLKDDHENEINHTKH